MQPRKLIHNLQVATCLYDFIEQQVLNDLAIKTDDFWANFSQLISKYMPENKRLLDTRQSLQQQIDQWHQQRATQPFCHQSYKDFLDEIGYIAKPVDDFSITTSHVDDEVATMAGPQLVVPIMNARFALNAVNARWGSLYDALYGSDVISDSAGAEKTPHYNPLRGQKVIDFARNFLDQSIPLATGSHRDVVNYQLSAEGLEVLLSNEQQTVLADPKQFVGFTGDRDQPEAMLFINNGLHFEINFDVNSDIGKADMAGISDLTLESALSTIMDCEDSVAAVDAADKVLAYRNWLGLNRGDLAEQVHKQNRVLNRVMANDRHYLNLTGEKITRKGRSLMFIRNVGHLMTNNCILTSDGHEVPEGIIDAVITSTIALYDLKRPANENNNTSKGSIYIVKPKMHGPEEVDFTNRLFADVEHMLNLTPNTIKMGIMDEERRTSVNLKNCIYAARERVAFINTGFLDRTGDEIHTSMVAGAMARKADIKLTPWISAYEDNNVDVGLACGLSGKAQIGKGMWPIPDNMADMLNAKISHVQAGANTAWVPSPTAATLHVLHYHQVNVFALHEQLKSRAPAKLDDILTIPLATSPCWSEQDVLEELANNVQGILGYVVRWIDQGIGCSKVPDINDIGLMEDRATLRISSQHIANWLKHGICSKQQVINVLEKMARIVDQQNSYDTAYQPMSTDFSNNIAFQAASALIFEGEQQPNGYTEPLLHRFRMLHKQQS
jgi:malate synthase